MKVISIVPIDKRRKKVNFEDGRNVALYNGEILRYQLTEMEELLEEQYEEIVETVLCKRARERVMHLLKSADRTEGELRRRLKEGYYPQRAIDAAIVFCKEYGYVDDDRYARRYVEIYGERKSSRKIRYELQNKGIGREMIDQALSCFPVNEEALVWKYLQKKGLPRDDMSRKDIAKLMQALARRGYSYEIISRVCREMTDLDVHYGTMD